jgi:hypothetical protein
VRSAEAGFYGDEEQTTAKATAKCGDPSLCSG